MGEKKKKGQNAPTGNRTRSPCMASRDFTIKPSVHIGGGNIMSYKALRCEQKLIDLLNGRDVTMIIVYHFIN